MKPWKSLSYSLSPFVKQHLVAMHSAGKIEYEDILFTGNYKGFEVENVDVGPDFGYFDYKTVPGLERDLEIVLQCVTPCKISVVTHEPHKYTVPHIDSYKYANSRRSVIIFPITPNSDHYAPTQFNPGGIKVPYSDSYLFNTDVEHFVENNEHWRINLQLWFNETFEEIATRVN